MNKSRNLLSKNVPKLMLSILLTILPVLGAAAESVSIASLEWPPYVGSELSNDGYFGEIISEAFSRAGKTIDLQYYPWARVKALAENGKVDAYGPEYYAKELEEQFVFSEPLPGGPAGLFKKKDSGIIYDNLKDLTKYKIGVVTGYVNEEEFDAADYLKKEEAASDEQNIRKLLAGRIDLFFADKLVVEYITRNAGIDPSSVQLIKTMVQQDLYLAFPKNVQGTKALVDAFNNAINDMKADGTLQKIQTKHGF